MCHSVTVVSGVYERTGRHFFVIIPNRKTTAKSDQREMRTKNAVFVYRLIKSCTQNKNAFMKEK